MDLKATLVRVSRTSPIEVGILERGNLTGVDSELTPMRVACASAFEMGILQRGDLVEFRHFIKSFSHCG
ncbi:Hypothetical predicted protein [Olea europaea subsp. europaea]|uniref:Uncharacterized protein n=1 Tax=Olea europaea subsp. europaea TaxID=158383 RepID=A0A8S0Q2B8_OLEEU|nr:Hypothetical predicted protein [Olea europaea subsp. europaea]